MNNIVLYKVPFSFGGVRQPYFTTEQRRLDYFNSCPSLPLNPDGMNIKVGLNYTIDFRANVNVVDVQKYNFAIVEYNSKKYYCNIIDCEFFSVDITAVYTKRNPMFEIISPFSYFENFNISEMSSQFFSYGANSERILPNNLRFYSNKLDIYEDNIWDNTSVNPHKKLQYRSYYPDGLTYLDTPNWLFIPFLSVFVKAKETDYTTVDLYDQYSQSYLYLIPLSTESYIFNYRDVDGNLVAANGGNPISSTHNSVIERLNEISADIASMQMIYLPCRVASGSTVENKRIVVPFVMHGYFNGATSSIAGFFRVSSPRFKTSNKLDTLVFQYDEAINDGISFNWKRIFESIDIQLFAKNLSQHIDFSDYASPSVQKITFEIEFEYIISDTGWTIRSTLKGKYPDARVPDSVTKVMLFPFIDKTSYNVTADAKFSGENAYYNELTNSYRNQKIIGHTVQAYENYSIGAAQMAQGASVLGSSNVIRGVFEGINMHFDDHFIEQQRELNALNEKAKPAEYFAASNSQVFWREQDNEIWFFHNSINANDFQAYKQHLKYYGYQVTLSAENINNYWLLNNATDGRFIYLKMVANISKNGILQARDYSELYNYISKGHCFEII